VSLSEAPPPRAAQAERAPDALDVSERVIFESRVGRWVSERVELPNGNVVTLETLRHPGAAVVLPFVADDRIVLLRQFRHAAGGWLWEAPAGKLDPGEAPEACALRELEEETGYRAGRLEKTGEILSTPGFTDERLHLFCARELTRGRIAREEAEVIEVHELPLAEALAMVDRGDLIDAKTIAALFHAARRAGSPELK
jgi:ADP-ribose pyrophosphatase